MISYFLVDVSQLRKNLHVSELTMSSDNSGFDDYQTSELATLAVHSSPKPTARRMAANLKLEDPFPNESFIPNSITLQDAESQEKESNLNELLWCNVKDNNFSKGMLRSYSLQSERSNALMIVEDLTDVGDHEVEYAAKEEIDPYSLVQYEGEFVASGVQSKHETNEIAKVKDETPRYGYNSLDPSHPSMLCPGIKYEPGYIHDQTSQELIFVDNLNEESDLDIDEGNDQQKESSAHMEVSNTDVKDLIVLRRSGQGRKLHVTNRHSVKMFRSKRHVKRIVPIGSRSKMRKQFLNCRMNLHDVTEHSYLRKSMSVGSCKGPQKVNKGNDIELKATVSHHAGNRRSKRSLFNLRRMKSKFLTSASKGRSKGLLRNNSSRKQNNVSSRESVSTKRYNLRPISPLTCLKHGLRRNGKPFFW